MVTRLGYDVVQISENGQDAVASAKRFQPDLILLDMNLPCPDDIIVTAREINTNLDIPVVFCVASPDLAMLARAKDLHCAGYLLKPVNPDSLATTLDTVLYKYKLEKRVRLAEEKFRELSGKCAILRFFFDEHAAYDWISSPQGEISFKDISAAHALFHKEITEKLSAIVAEAISCNGRISTLLSVDVGTAGAADSNFVVIGTVDKDDGSVSGMLIPLSQQSGT
jgi:CheY-like chemotaxis protein